MMIMDETGNTRVVLWGDKAEPVENGKIKRGDIVQVRSGYTRTGLSGEVELHIGRRGGILVNPAISEPMPEIQETKVKVKDVADGARDVTIEGVVSSVSNVRKFNRADGASGRVATLFLRDETGEIRVSLWNEKTDGLEDVQKGNRVHIAGAYTKVGFNDSVELHCSSSSEITVSQEVEEELPVVERTLTPISGLTDGMQTVDLGGRVERALGRRTFTRLNGQEGKVGNLIIADGTGEVRLVLWGDAADMVPNLVEGTRVAVENAYTKLGLNQEMEVHVGWRGRIVVQVEEFKPMACDLERGMENVDLEVGVVEVGLPEEFDDAKLVSTVVGDASGRVPAVFWDGHVDPVLGLEAGTGLRLRNVKVNDLGEIQVLPESSLELLDTKVVVLGEEDAGRVMISSAQTGSFCRVRGAALALADLRRTSSFGGERLLCSALVDDGSGQMAATIFGGQCGKLFEDGGEARGIEDLRAAFRKGVEMVFEGVVVNGSLRVRQLEAPDSQSEIEALMGGAGEEP
jgi:replication factor A1